tara:strand:- start:212 stop:544 length:333 start_codon:yes stop_codon:yes gene_type:complete
MIERARAHFEAQELKQTEVPEWADEKGNPAIIYSEPLTLQDRKVLAKFSDGDDMEFLVRLVILKCLTSDGQKVFDLSDKPTLMNKADPAVITRLANKIAESMSVEGMLGN